MLIGLWPYRSHYREDHQKAGHQVTLKPITTLPVMEKHIPADHPDWEVICNANPPEPLYHHEEDKHYIYAGILLKRKRINKTTIALILIALGYGIMFVIFNWKH